MLAAIETHDDDFTNDFNDEFVNKHTSFFILFSSSCKPGFTVFWGRDGWWEVEE